MDHSVIDEVACQSKNRPQLSQDGRNDLRQRSMVHAERCATEWQAHEEGHLYQQRKKGCNQITNGGHSNEKESIRETNLQGRSVAT